jgi:Flp pilus assembly pilin Flp
MHLRGEETARRPPKRSLKEERGVALVEFALVVPLLLLLILGMVDFGKAYTMWIDETHLANQTARYAAVNSAPTNPCTPPNCLETQMEDQGDTQELRDSLDEPGNGITITFPSGKGCVGDPIKASVKAKSQFFSFLDFLPGLDGAGKKTLTASATMRIEKAYNSGGSNAYAAVPPTPTCP